MPLPFIETKEKNEQAVEQNDRTAAHGGFESPTPVFNTQPQKSTPETEGVQGQAASETQAQAPTIKTMPARFYLEETETPHAPKIGFWVIILVIVAVVITGGLGAIYYLTTKIQQAENEAIIATETEREMPQPSVEQDDTVREQDRDNTDIVEDTTVTVALPVDEGVEGSDEDIIEIEAMPIAPPVPANGVDTDGDGLTNIEEVLYGTNSERSDTDNDTYADGSEVANQYNPKGAGTLAESGIFARVHGFPFTFFYPVSWQRTGTVAVGEMSFTAPTGEFFQFLVEDNVGSLSLAEWYQEQSGVPINVQAQTSVAGYPAVRSVDGLTIYIAKQDKVSIFSYNAGPGQALNYKATFSYIIDTIEDAEE